MPAASGQSSACLAGEHGQGEPQAELRGKPPPTAAYAGPSPPLQLPGEVCLCPIPSPSKAILRPELKKGRLKSTAGREPSPELPRGQSRPSPGEPRSEHPHSLQIGSLAPLPNTRLIRTTCPQANETPGSNSVHKASLGFAGPVAEAQFPPQPQGSALTYCLSWGSRSPTPSGV